MGLFAAGSSLRAQGTAFTYQGQLQNNATPANGSYDLTFALFNTNLGGAPVSGTVTNSAAVVSNGLFIVTMQYTSSDTTHPTVAGASAIAHWLAAKMAGIWPQLFYAASPP